MSRLILLIATFCILVLSSCSSMKSTDASEEKQKLRTAKVNVQLGIAYLERNDVNRAKKKLLMALDQAPNMPEAWYSMAYLLESTGNTEQAKKYYLKALSLGPERGDVQNNYGTFLCRSGAYDESIDHFMLAVKDPDYLDTSDAYENAGLCALKIPNKKLAYSYFTTAITQNPSRPASLAKLAQLDYDMGNYQKAKISLDQYLAIAPASSKTSSLMANIKKHLASGKKSMHNDAFDDEPTDDDSPAKKPTHDNIKTAMPKRMVKEDSEVYYQESDFNALPAKKVHAATKPTKHKPTKLSAKKSVKSKTLKGTFIAKSSVVKARIKPRATPIVVANNATKNERKKPVMIAKPKEAEKAFSWSV